MPTSFVRPLITAIISRVGNDIEGALEGVNARLRRRFEYGLTRAVSGASHTLHAHLAWVAEQILPDQAAEKFLLRWADLFGVDRKPAVRTQLTLAITGTGGALADTAQFSRAGDGAAYDVDTTVINVTTNTCTVTAAAAGLLGNMDVGQKVSLVSPIAGVNSEATVTAVLVQGSDIEKLSDVLKRLRDRIRKPPMGGAPGDHVLWALEVAGVTRAWEYPRKDGSGAQGLGKVALTFVCDGNDPLGVDIIPDNTKVQEVQDYLTARSPAQVLTFAPTPIAFHYAVTLTPNTGSVRAAVEDEVRDMLRRDAEPNGTIPLSRLNEAISIADGEESHVLLTPSADVSYPFGQIPVYGTPSFS